MIINPYRFRLPEVDPTSLSGLEVWVDFSDSTGRITVSGRISQMLNKAQPWSFLQPTAAYRPLLVSSAQNGLDVARFDAARGDILTATNRNVLKNVGGATVFVVRRIESYQASGNMFRVGRSSTSPVRSRLQIRVSNATLGRSQIQGMRRDAPDDPTYGSVTSLNSKPIDVFDIAGGSINYTNATAFLYDRGYLERYGDSFTSTGNTSNTNSSIITIGGFNTANQSFDGDIGEILLYNRVLSDEERKGVEAYLRNKWNVR